MGKLERVGITIALLALTGCATLQSLNDQISIETFGSDFDALCIVGKVKKDSAAWLNDNQDTWKQHGRYADHRQPTPVKKNDRLFNGDCSEVTKALGSGRWQDALDALEDVADGGQ